MQRLSHLQQLKTQSFDLLVIGGGATGAGTVLDAATRGLKAALVEREDFAAGTSSRSTKLLHGGVRYLELAVKNRDKSQIDLVREALHERALLLKLAPHLTRTLSIFTPLYSWLKMPYYRAGLKIYDWLAGEVNLAPSSWMDAQEAKAHFPMLKHEGLRGGILYYDGQFDDARMNISLALTAAEQGATLVNHAEVTQLVKTQGKITGAMVRDCLSGETFQVIAKAIINATGPFADSIRKMDDPAARPMLTASSGIHIILGKRFTPPDTGLLTPKTEDGRVLFLLPWLNHTLVGTTDHPAPIEENPKAGEEDIDYLLRHINKNFGLPITRKDILASWSGLRPLVSDPSHQSTSRLSRDHVIFTSPAGLVTIAGGKWTTYRKMALDAVNEAVQVAGLQPSSPSKTEVTMISGGKKFTPELVYQIQSRFNLPPDIAQNLVRAYGDKAPLLAELTQAGYGARLSESLPYIEAEVLYGIHQESAQTAIDILARRTRIAFLEIEAAKQALPRVIELMGQEFRWDKARCTQEQEGALAYLS